MVSAPVLSPYHLKSLHGFYFIQGILPSNGPCFILLGIWWHK